MSSSDYAISVRNLGKRYLMPHRRGRGWRAHLREFFPAFAEQREDDYFCALCDLDLDVKRGEILGDIGHNGSGKSTLLKLLSRVTLPTPGRALLRGRVGSLLEVGTGFHPDLTGRENVFMAGALLGLPQREIRARFAAIVDFSGVEQFIDVPIKRYSSGMYVRLAYAVASTLESDILILDEVLAVGDAAFREKSQETIEKVGHDGRAVLQVSCNARAVTSICQRAIVLDGGRWVFQGTAEAAVALYLRNLHGLEQSTTPTTDNNGFQNLTSDKKRVTDAQSVLRWVSLHQAEGIRTTQFCTGDTMIVRIGYAGTNVRWPYFAVFLLNDFAERVATFQSTHAGEIGAIAHAGVVECFVPQLLLGEGAYWLMSDFGEYHGGTLATCLDCVGNAINFRITLNGYVGGVGVSSYQGLVQRTRWQATATVLPMAIESPAPPSSRDADVKPQ